MSSNSGCAVASDGSLLSPSKIDFYNDPDDVAPISGPSLIAPVAHLAPMRTSSATTLETYFGSHQPAAKKLPGVRRTTRPSKPSAQVWEVAGSPSKSAISRKRKGTNVSPHCHLARKVVLESDSDSPNVSSVRAGSICSEAANDTTDSDGTDIDKELLQVQAAYYQTKEMGDEDREVRSKFQQSIIGIDPSEGQQQLH
jgi:hypothetical protein